MPNANYSITFRLKIDDTPGMFGRIASAIGAVGGNLGSIDLVSVAEDYKLRDVTVDCRDEGQAREVEEAIRAGSRCEYFAPCGPAASASLGGEDRG